MMNLEQAKQLALKKLEELQQKSISKLVILDDQTLPFQYGWVFFYQSESFIKTSDPRERLGGNAPIMVDMQNGNVLTAGTRKDISFYIDSYSKMKEEWNK